MGTREVAQRNGKKGGRPAGRPKGMKNKATLEREAVMKAMNQRIMGIATRLLDKQLTLAMGQTYLYKIEKEKVVGPKGGISYRSLPAVLITDELQIRDYLDGLCEDGDAKDNSDPATAYYYITTKDPNSTAIDSMFNRAFGKAIQAVAFTDIDGRDIVNNEKKKKSKAAVSQILGGTGNPANT